MCLQRQAGGKMTHKITPTRRFTLMFTLVLALSLCAGALGEQAAPQAHAAPLYTNPQEDLIIYETPDNSRESGAFLPAGMACQVLEQQGEWASILYVNLAGDVDSGWVRGAGLRQKTAEDAPSYGIVNSPDPLTRVPLFQKASSKAKTFGKYYNGAVVQVLAAPEKNFVKVRVGSLEGYMKPELLALDAPFGSVVPTLPTPQVQHPKYAGLTLRAAQSYQSEKLGSAGNGQTVRVIGITEEFAHVILDSGLTGFMQASALAPQPVYADLDPGIFTAEPEGMATVIDNPDGQGAHLRAKGSTASESLGLYMNGTRVIVTGGTTWWRKVWVDGKTGYMMAKLLRDFVPEDNPDEDHMVAGPSDDYPGDDYPGDDN